MAGISIGKNLASLKTQRQLEESSYRLGDTLARLSSGMRINRASDDAAGLSIVSSLRSDSRVFSQGMRNVNDGISALNIADSAVSNLSGILMRIRELTMESANGTYKNTQRQALDREANQLVAEYNRIIATSKFNGLTLLDGTLSEFVLQAGYSRENLSLGSALRSRTVGNGTFTDAGALAFGSVSGNLYSQLSDVNGDGKLDVVTIGDIGTTGSVRLGNGNGTFAAEQTFTVTSGSNSLAIGDSNHDNRPDLFVFAPNGTVNVLLGNGNGTFAAAVPYSLSGAANFGDVDVGDLNGDGHLDFVATSQNLSTLYTFIGNGNGTFQAPTTYTGFGSAYRVAVGDVNNDNRPDVVVGGFGGSSNKMFLNNGSGGLVRTSDVGVFNSAEHIVLIDVNRDGKLDHITSTTDPTPGLGGVAVSLGNGDGTFGAKTVYDSATESEYLAMGDFNGDGFIDIAHEQQVLINSGTGTFTTTTQTGMRYVTAAGDLNGDGVSDLLANGDAISGLRMYTANTTTSGGLPAVDLTTQTTALNSLSTLDTAFLGILSEVSNIGAAQSRLRVALNALRQSSENYLAAAGQISDVDVAQESAKLVKEQILQKIGGSLLAQANQLPNTAIDLLKNARI